MNEPEYSPEREWEEILYFSERELDLRFQQDQLDRLDDYTPVEDVK